MVDDKITRYKTIKIYGLDVENVREKLLSISFPDGVSHKLTVDGSEVHIILWAAADTEDDAKQLIKPVSKAIKKLLGDYIYTTKYSENIQMAVVRLLDKYELTVTTAESCTGGLVAARIIDVPGASDVFREGFITYSNKAKRKTLDVSKGTLKKYGAVSKQTAKEMATGAIFAADADVSLAVTGIAGPDGGTEEKPVGLVYIACYINDKVTVEEHHFDGDRGQIREQSVIAALNLLRTCILNEYHN